MGGVLAFFGAKFVLLTKAFVRVVRAFYRKITIFSARQSFRNGVRDLGLHEAKDVEPPHKLPTSG